jgi:hypothetical protein
MQFHAIVHAPCLREGARLNIAEADQRLDVAPAMLDVGSNVCLRFGVCCPDHASGRIVEATEQPARVVMQIGERRWALTKRGDRAISDPGLVSEDWYVAEDVTRAA